jgi:hypothetical protein
LNAVSTRWTWSASAFAASEQEDVEEEAFCALPDGLAVAVLVVTDADALADALGLADGSVIVIVVTPLEADTLTSAPVAPSRKMAEIAPDFAWSRRDSSFANMSPPLSGYTV